MQHAQFGTRLDADLLAEPVPELLVGTERLGDPAGAVERDDQVMPESLVERVHVDHVEQFGDQPVVLSEGQLKFHTPGPRPGPCLGEQCRRGPDQPAGQAVQRGTTPEVECGPQQRDGRRGPSGVGRPVGLRDQVPEQQYVDVRRRYADPVTGRLGTDHRRRYAGLTEQPTQLGHDDGQLATGGRRRMPVPHRLDQPFRRHRPVRLEQEGGEHGRHPGAADPYRDAGDLDREGTQDSEPHTRLRRRARDSRTTARR